VKVVVMFSHLVMMLLIMESYYDTFIIEIMMAFLYYGRGLRQLFPKISQKNLAQSRIRTWDLFYPKEE
jgi:hypothetical protein